MVHTKLKKRLGQSEGFTIVELLIVIIVIGVLATITIISYAGVTGRANLAKAQSDAETVQKVAEAFNGDCGYYPKLVGGANSLTTGCASPLAGGSASAKLPSALVAGTNVLAGTAPTSSTADVGYFCTLTSAVCDGFGAKITYWDATTSAVSTKIVYVGTASASSTYGALPAS